MQVGHFNVINQDCMRVHVTKLMMKVAHMTACVFDEVDNMYNETLGTSTCMPIANMAPIVIAQTGTAIRSSRNIGLVRWLQKLGRSAQFF